MFTWLPRLRNIYPWSMIDFDNLYYENANSKNFCVMALSCKVIFFCWLSFCGGLYFDSWILKRKQIHQPKQPKQQEAGQSRWEMARIFAVIAFYEHKFVFLTRRFSVIESFASISGRLNLFKRSYIFQGNSGSFSPYPRFAHKHVFALRSFSRSTHPSQLGSWAILFSTC